MLERGIELADNNIKKILKVALYTTLNGGKPTNHQRLISNLAVNAQEYLQTQVISTDINIYRIEELDIYKAVKECLSNFDLLKEIDAVYNECYTQRDVKIGDKLLLKLVPKVQEFSRKQNQFTANQLKETRHYNKRLKRCDTRCHKCVTT